jgi:glutamyl-Q tRNA(Asp) synthetase
MTDPTLPTFRFAPSPNGRLHLGHAFSALLNAQLAERLGGRLLLRIEDIDITRCRPEFTDAIDEDLGWLGIRWEHPVRRQSEHFDDYRAAFSTLRDSRMVFPCFCSRKDLAEAAHRPEPTGSAGRRDPDGAPLYPGTCRHLPAAEVSRRIQRGDPHTWRLDSAAACRAFPEGLAYRRLDADGDVTLWPVDPARWGDAVIVRREIPTSYHLSVVVDDALQHVTHVVRGQDLEAATDLHVLLQRLLRLRSPIYRHHALLLEEQGGKLAKSRFSETLRDLREAGISAGEIRQRLGFA